MNRHGPLRRKGQLTSTILFTLRNNPYHFLRKIYGPAKRHLLKHEHLFVKAMVSRNVEDFWQYLEALIPNGQDGDNQIREVVSSIALLIAEKSRLERIGSKIAWAVQPFNAASSVLGMTSEQQMKYYDEMQNKKTINFNRLKTEIKHPFIEHLLAQKDKRWSKDELYDVKQYYERMLLEGYSQRNAIIHTGEGYHKSLIGVNETLPWLVNKFRQAIFKSLHRHKKLSFDDVLNEEMSNVRSLLWPTRGNPITQAS
jgi:hypothetical protein